MNVGSDEGSDHISDPISDDSFDHNSDTSSELVTDHNNDTNSELVTDHNSDSINNQTSADTKFISIVKHHIKRIIKLVRKIHIDYLDYQHRYRAEPSWFEWFDCTEYRENPKLPHSLNELLLEKQIYDTFEFDYEYEYEEEEVIDLVYVRYINGSIIEEPTYKTVRNRNRKPFVYPKLSTHSRPEVLQLLADEINEFHSRVSLASTFIERRSNDLIRKLEEESRSSTANEKFSSILHEYINEILHESIIYSRFHEILYILTIEMCDNNQLDCLLENTYYLFAGEMVEDETCSYSIRSILESLIQLLEDELSHECKDIYTRLLPHREDLEWFTMYDSITNVADYIEFEFD